MAKDSTKKGSSTSAEKSAQRNVSKPSGSSGAVGDAGVAGGSRGKDEGNGDENRGKVPRNFVKTPFVSQVHVTSTQFLNAFTQQQRNDLLNKPCSRWGNVLLGLVMNQFSRMRSLKVDDAGGFNSIYEKFDAFLENREDLVDALDPGYVYINWMNVPPVPVAQWEHVSVPVATIQNWPNCYRTDTLLNAGILAGLLKAQFGKVAVFPFFQKLVIREV